MKNIQLLRLTLDNFKGCRHLELDLDGRDLTVYGTNAAGKTTIYDALTWLLFGKDSRGRGSFEIKPLDKTGQVLDHTAITIVEALLLADHEELALRRTYYERWSTKRGSAVETFDGHSSDFYVDGVPVKKYEFEDTVSQLVDEDLFRALTDVRWFCQTQSWQERRAVLFQLAQVEDDRTLMARDPRFTALAEALGRSSLTDYCKKLQAERKALMGVRSDGPVRLDECQKHISELEGVDFESLRQTRDEKVQARDALSADLLKLRHNTLLESRRNERGGLQNQRDALEQENLAHRRSQTASGPDAEELEQALRREERSLQRLVQERKSSLSAAAQYEADIQRCREQWKQLNAQTFSGAECPVCGRPLEGTALAEAEANFQRDKADRLSGLVRKSEEMKSLLASVQTLAEAAAADGAKAEQSIAWLKEQLEQARADTPPAVEDLPGYREKREGLDARIAALDREIKDLEADGSAVRETVQAQISMLDKEIDTLNAAYAQQGMLDAARRRMEDLRAELSAAAKRLEQLDAMVSLCEAFVRYKTQYIEGSVNERFGLVRWKLFEEQVNGGLAECCEAAVDGVPYASLNSGAQVNAGLDVISALSLYYGVRVPLVVDNAESVTRLLPLDTQVIRLVVSEFDTELRFAYGT